VSFDWLSARSWLTKLELRGFSDSREDRMSVHKTARLTPRSRERIIRQVTSVRAPEAVAEAAGVCPRTVRKWVVRYRSKGMAGLQDRSSRPHRLHRPTPQVVVAEIERLRRQRWTGKQIAAETGVLPATVSRVLRRLGLNKLSALEPAEPIRRMNVTTRAGLSTSMTKGQMPRPRYARKSSRST
jgi:transposase